MVSFEKLLCVSFLLVSVNSQVMSQNLHVAHAYMTSVFFFLFPLIRDLQFVYVMHLMQFWPGAKHSSNNAISVRRPELEAFILPFIQLKSLINMESK